MLGDLIHVRRPAADAIVRSVTRVGESITFSAATVIAAVLTLLLASFTFYSDLAVPFAIAIAVTLVAALTLLPALLSIRLSLLAAKRTLFRAMFGRPKLLPWNIQSSGKSGVWGQVAERVVRHPVPTLLAVVVVFGALAFAVLGYTRPSSAVTCPRRGQRLGRGQALLTKHFPQAAANPTSVIFQFSDPVCRPGAAGHGDEQAAGQRAVHAGDRPAEPGGRAPHPGAVHSLPPSSSAKRSRRATAQQVPPPCMTTALRRYAALRRPGLHMYRAVAAVVPAAPLPGAVPSIRAVTTRRQSRSALPTPRRGEAAGI